MPAKDFAAATRQLFITMANAPSQLEPLLAAIQRSDQRAMADAFYELFTTDITPTSQDHRAPARHRRRQPLPAVHR